MVVNVDQIPPEGLTLDEPVTAALLKEAMAGTSFAPTKDTTLHARFEKVSGGVLLRGKFPLSVQGPCKRCVTDVKLELPVEFTLNLIPESLARGDDYVEEGEGDDDQKGERGGTFSLKDADEELFNGKQIELDPIVREQVLLALPMDLLCKEACKGLCAQCGTNLNEQQCSCEQKPVDPRLAVLKNIKLKPQA